MVFNATRWDIITLEIEDTEGLSQYNSYKSRIGVDPARWTQKCLKR